MSKLDGTKVRHAAHMQSCPGGPGFQLCSIGIGFMKLRSSVQSLPHSLSLGKACRCWSHPRDTETGTCLEMRLWAPFSFISPSRRGCRGAGEPQDCGGPACPVPVGAAPLVAPGAGRHRGSGRGLTCSIVLIPWGYTSWIQYWI